jgi:uridine phosphorylase
MTPDLDLGEGGRARVDSGDLNGNGLGFLARTDHAEPSVFLPQGLLREARRQRGLPPGSVPPVCVLDPDGDLVDYLERGGRAARSPVWACYHTDLIETEVAGARLGLVGRAVGAPFAVLVAEELFASGCELLVSVTSAGMVAPDLPRPCLVLIERALRGEGTSHAYLPPAPAVAADPALIAAVARSLADAGVATLRGATWTTDAPFRETPSALAAAAAAGALAVEMEAAALYAFAAAARRPVVCFAHVTNALAVTDGDFEKGPANGAEEALRVVAAAARGWRDGLGGRREA